MTYTTFLGDTFEDEHDEELCRKFGDTYKFFKNEYPGLYKLPTEDVRDICHKFRESTYGDTFEKSVDRTKQYINQRMPEWNIKYINPTKQSFNDSKPINTFDALSQKTGAMKDLVQEYFKMKEHNYAGMDDYHHCKANYNAVKRGYYGEQTAQNLGFAKELVDKVKNNYIKDLSIQEVENDFRHDLMVNATGRARAKFGNYDTAMEACADFRNKNKKFPEKYW